MNEEDPIAAWARKMNADRNLYNESTLESQEFKNGLKYLVSVTTDFLSAQSYVRLQGSRLPNSDDYLLLRYAPHFVESVLAVGMNAKEGMQNAARRELRFMLEAAIKLSSRDFCPDATTFEDRLSVLGERGIRFEDYVATLGYFNGFERPDEANAEILSLYSDLSRYVHATDEQFRAATRRSQRGEQAGMESVATLNSFNKLAFRVCDLVLVRIFYSIGESMAGDVFTSVLDDESKWRFHKGKFVSRMSRCFDDKHERRVRRGEI